MNDLKIFSGPANPALTQDICRYLNLPMGKISLGRFPDGEISCKIDEDVRGRDVFIVQPTSPPRFKASSTCQWITSTPRPCSTTTSTRSTSRRRNSWW